MAWWVGKARRFRLSASSSGDPREAPGVNMARIGPSGGTASELEYWRCNEVPFKWTRVDLTIE